VGEAGIGVSLAVVGERTGTESCATPAPVPRPVGGELGVLTEDDNLELLEGYLVHKMSRNPPHDACLQKTAKKNSVPLVLDGVTLAHIPVDDLLP
jgi:hypothetical protein